MVTGLQNKLIMVTTYICGANQPVNGWLGGQWFPEPTRVKVLVLAFTLG